MVNITTSLFPCHQDLRNYFGEYNITVRHIKDGNRNENVCLALVLRSKDVLKPQNTSFVVPSVYFPYLTTSLSQFPYQSN